MGLVNEVRNLMGDSSVSDIVKSRVDEFRSRKSGKEVFKELCFCILTANFDAERTIVMQKGIGDGFLKLSEKQLARKLRIMGHRRLD